MQPTVENAKLLATILAVVQKQGIEIKEEVVGDVLRYLEVVEGPEGKQGEPGEPGLIGEQGEVGPQGEKGEKGEKGDQGVQGLIGEKGEQGEKGEKGDTGPQGNDGVAGIKGPAGAMGRQGAKGNTGKTGKTGAKGSTGKTGPAGERGPVGKDGKPGADGAVGKDGVPGQNGVDGAPGPEGPRGLKGAKGAKGEKGDPGIPGKDGAPGTDAKVDEALSAFQEKLRADWNTYRARLNQQLSTLGGGGSTRILDNDDVVFSRANQLANNDILIFNTAIQKFQSLNIADIIATVGATLEVQFDKLIDETVQGANTFTYVGEAAPGSTTGQPVWRIKRIDEISGNTVTTILWANNEATFVNTWDDRVTYSYDV